MATIVEDVQANEQIYESQRSELERMHWGQWVVIVKGQVVAIAPTREEAVRQAGTVPPDALSRLVRKIGAEVPKVVRKL
jgi:hypothetical protein